MLLAVAFINRYIINFHYVSNTETEDVAQNGKIIIFTKCNNKVDKTVSFKLHIFLHYFTNLCYFFPNK